MTFRLEGIFFPRLSLFARLAIASGLFLLVSTSLFVWILVTSDLRSLRHKLSDEVQEHKADFVSIITEKAIIGDYATIEQYFRSRVSAEDIYSLSWTDGNGNVVAASLKPRLSSAPGWFQKWADRNDLIASANIEVGGRQYGTFQLKHTAVDGIDTIWHSLTVQIRLIFVSFFAFMVATLLMLRRSLRPIGNLAVAADRFGEGDFSARVPPTSLPDMEQSVQAFNNMAGIIESLLQQHHEQEQLLLKSEARLIEAQRIAHIGCWELDHETGSIFCSEEIYRIVDRHPDQSDSSFDGYLKLVHPDDRAMVRASFFSSLEQRAPISIACRLLASDNRIKHVQWQWETYFDDAGKPLHSLGTVQDVTAIKEAETEKQNLMAQLNQSQRIESIGRLAAGIAHDFNNLLTPIIGYAGMLSQTLPSDSRDLAKAKNILLAANKAKVLTQQILGFGRKQILDMKVISLNEVITSFHDILQRTIRENIEIRLCLSNENPGIKADKSQLEQIIMNLVVNGQDAISGKGVITIESEVTVLDEDFARQHPDVMPGRYLMLAVSDTGSGMDNDTLSRLFEPFYTTKAMGRGSGLGLATVYGLVKQHEGHIWVFSEIGKGTVFKLYFPIVAATADAAQESVPEQPVLIEGKHSILLVEDNETVRAMVSEQLALRGFEVIEAEGPVQAVNLIHGRQVDLLVTDVVMPEMSGLELHNLLIKSRPGLKVLFMSGYTDTTIDRLGIYDDGCSFLRKPFTEAELVSKVAALLDKRDPSQPV
jgi:signal transduction histidine kinase/CheY-like chemotaxis protein/HAMP domain-containing protein